MTARARAPAAAARARPRSDSRPSLSRHPIEYLLTVFADVRPGEAGTALLLALDVFLILSAYYLVKVAREPLILLERGAEAKSYAAVAQSLVLLGVAAFYGWLATRVNRVRLISYVTLFFAANLVGFALLGARGARLGVPFFFWVGVFNIVTTAQFWSLAADVYTEEQGQRLFPVIGIGASLGAIGGAEVAGPLLRHGSPYALMLAAAGVLGASLVVTLVIHERTSHEAPAGHPVHAPLPAGSVLRGI
ncbi:MAG TPA: hypothetical protein VHB21_12850, partial [Minicystis sp.]|nr:hypothetical protein [Minicystis sp.]